MVTFDENGQVSRDKVIYLFLIATEIRDYFFYQSASKILAIQQEV